MVRSIVLAELESAVERAELGSAIEEAGMGSIVRVLCTHPPMWMLPGLRAGVYLAWVAVQAGSGEGTVW